VPGEAGRAGIALSMFALNVSDFLSGVCLWATRVKMPFLFQTAQGLVSVRKEVQKSNLFGFEIFRFDQFSTGTTREVNPI
jgi:hypothetical protein